MEKAVAKQGCIVFLCGGEMKDYTETVAFVEALRQVCEIRRIFACDIHNPQKVIDVVLGLSLIRPETDPPREMQRPKVYWIRAS